MRRLLKICVYIFLATVVLLSLNLFDIIALHTVAFRICCTVCIVSLFALSYSRVWLIRYRRKTPKHPKA